MKRLLLCIAALAMSCGVALAQQGNPINMPAAVGGGQAPCNAFGSNPGKCVQGNQSGTITQLTAGIGTAPTVTAGGGSYVNGDTITLADGCSTHAVLLVTNASGGVIQAGGISVQTAGICNSPPPNPIAQGSTSGSGSAATFTVANSQWIGSYAITRTQFRVCLIGGGGGAGGVSNVSGANASPGNASPLICARYVGQTIGGPISYNLGIPGAGAAAGANNGTAGSNTVFGTVVSTGGSRGNGSSSGNAAAGAGIANLVATLPAQLLPTSSVMVESQWSQPQSQGGGAGGTQGASSAWGVGGAGGANAGGSAATGCGAGGGAPSSTQTSVSYAGGNGSGGCIFALTDW